MIPLFEIVSEVLAIALFNELTSWAERYSLDIPDNVPKFINAIEVPPTDIVTVVPCNSSAGALIEYPKDETPGCTAQACSFRDSYDDFKDAGAEVIGISSDGTGSHEGLSLIHISEPTRPY